MVLILASGSETRQALLRNAGVPFEVERSRVDEDTIKASLEAEKASPRDIADALAEAKARKVAQRHPDALVVGCDQTLDHHDALISKPRDPGEAIRQLQRLSGDRHTLHSAIVAYDAGEPVWRHIGTVRLTMRDLSDAYIRGYVERTWPDIRASVGGYQIEGEGVRLFRAIEGDHFSILGLPLLPLLSWLIDRGTLQT